MVILKWTGRGFGEVLISIHKNGKIVIESEHMGRDFVKAVLCKLVDDAEVL